MITYRADETEATLVNVAQLLTQAIDARLVADLRGAQYEKANAVPKDFGYDAARFAGGSGPRFPLQRRFSNGI